MIHVTDIAYTGYPVTDIARARGFYEGLLNLKPTATWESEGKHWIEYDIGATTLAISNMWANWRPAADGPVAGLEVADFDAAMAALRDRCVKITVGPVDSGACHLAVVSDPDGNSLAIHHRHVR